MTLLNTNHRKGLMALLGCFLLVVCAGEFNLLSFLYKYFCSYFRLLDNPNLTEDDLSIIPQIHVFGVMVMSFLSLKVRDKLGYRGSYFVFLSLFSISKLVMSFQTNFYVFAVMYSTMAGSIEGLLQVLPIYTCYRYFPEKYRPRVAGTLMAAFALTPMITSPLVLKLVNPDNLKPTLSDGKYFDKEVAMMVPTFLRLYSLISFIIGSIAILMITEPYKEGEEDGLQTSVLQRSENMLTFQDGETSSNQESLLKSNNQQNQGSTNEQQIQQVDESSSSEEPMSMREMLSFFGKSRFNLIYLCMFIGFFYPNFQSFYWKTKGIEELKDDHWVSTCGVVGMIFNLLSRIGTAAIYEKCGFLVAATCLYTSSVISTLTFEVALQNEIAFMGAVCTLFWSYGGQHTLYPLAFNEIYKEKGGEAYSVGFSAFCMSQIVTLIIKTYLNDILSYKEILTFYTVIAASGFIPTVLVYCLMKQDRKNKEYEEEKAKIDIRNTQDLD